jgi:hypothetical protein
MIHLADDGASTRLRDGSIPGSPADDPIFLNDHTPNGKLPLLKGCRCLGQGRQHKDVIAVGIFMAVR